MFPQICIFTLFAAAVSRSNPRCIFSCFVVIVIDLTVFPLGSSFTIETGSLGPVTASPMDLPGGWGVFDTLGALPPQASVVARPFVPETDVNVDTQW